MSQTIGNVLGFCLTPVAGQDGSRMRGFCVSQSVDFNGIKFQISSVKPELSGDSLCTLGAGYQVPHYQMMERKDMWRTSENLWISLPT